MTRVRRIIAGDDSPEPPAAPDLDRLLDEFDAPPADELGYDRLHGCWLLVAERFNVVSRSGRPRCGAGAAGGVLRRLALPSELADRPAGGVLRLHEGGEAFLDLPLTKFTKEQVSPTRDTRLRWMQSVVHCTHYVAGASEQDYLRREDAPEITYLKRDPIERSDEAYTEIPT